MKATLRLILASTTALIALTALIAPAAATETEAECNSHTVSGTIRWTSKTTWITLNDAGHASTGIASVEVLKDRVRIHYDFTAAKVGSLQVTPDETFAASDVRVGASVDLDHADIYFYMPKYGKTPVPPALLSARWANVWITGIFDQVCS